MVGRAERLLGGRAASWARVESRGWARNEHWTLVLDDGTRAFAKSAWLEPSVSWMRQEREVYGRLSGPFMPRLLGWEDGDRPLLVLEDLTDGAHFPPPWRRGDVDAVLATLAELGEVRVEGLSRFPDEWPQWTAVADDPAPLPLARNRLAGVARRSPTRVARGRERGALLGFCRHPRRRA
jgi:hypothetical protein